MLGETACFGARSLLYFRRVGFPFRGMRWIVSSAQNLIQGAAVNVVLLFGRLVDFVEEYIGAGILWIGNLGPGHLPISRKPKICLGLAVPLGSVPM